MASVTLVGGPTALIEYGGLRWLTDPTFSEPGAYENLVKTTAPAIPAEQLGQVDVVLLSHDQHSDNLDPGGRAFLPMAGRVLSTPAAAQRLGGNVLGLGAWQQTLIAGGSGGVVVTAVPAQHGPAGCEPVTGPVTGFVLACEGSETLYVSGDNASVEVVREIAERLGPIDVAILFVGAVQIPARFDGAYLTLSSDRAAQAVELLGARAAIPVHFEGWTHFTQGLDQVRAAFAGYGLSDRLLAVERGQTVEF
jgi:L-ascorbate metabolism protein UlaG (beta-lactamase superfamily)